MAGRDQIDVLIDTLNDGVDGVIFDRDVLDTNRPEDWGAVEVKSAINEYADGRIIDQTLTVDLWVCVSDRTARTRTSVQTALESFAATGQDITWLLKERSYLYDLDKVMWHWVLTVWGPIEMPDEPEEPEDGDA